MRPISVVPVQVVGDVGPCSADSVVGLQVHPPILHAAPQTLEKDVISPGTTRVNSSAVNWLPRSVLTISGAPQHQRQLDHLLDVNGLLSGLS